MLKTRWFSVIVPVLSVHNRFTDPKSWTAESRLTMTSRLANSKAPRESENVSTKGKASGMADTAKAIAKISRPVTSASRPSIRMLANTTRPSVSSVTFMMKLLILSTLLTSSLSAWTVDAVEAICANCVS